MTRIVMMIGRELYPIYVIAYVNDYLLRESALLQA